MPFTRRIRSPGKETHTCNAIQCKTTQCTVVVSRSPTQQSTLTLVHAFVTSHIDMPDLCQTENRSGMCSIRGTWKNKERKEHLHRNQNETLLRPGSASLVARLRMLESEERGRAKARPFSSVAEISWLRRIIGRSRREKVRNEQTREELGARKQWYKRSRKGDYSGLDTWKGWRRKDYQMQLYVDMYSEREAERDRGRPGWTMSGKT